MQGNEAQLRLTSSASPSTSDRFSITIPSGPVVPCPTAHAFRLSGRTDISVQPSSTATTSSMQEAELDDGGEHTRTQIASYPPASEQSVRVDIGDAYRQVLPRQ